MTDKLSEKHKRAIEKSATACILNDIRDDNRLFGYDWPAAVGRWVRQDESKRSKQAEAVLLSLHRRLVAHVRKFKP